MSCRERSSVLSILQPDLLSVEELVQIIHSRCSRAENLRLMPKEGLVELFRRVVLPLPQRLYRTNRRGKMLTARRAKAGLGSDRNDERSLSGSRALVKPPPGIHDTRGLREGGGGENGEASRGRGRSGGTSGAAVTDGRREQECSGEGGEEEKSSCSRRRITLKRPSSGTEKPRSMTPPTTERKRQRTAIKWP